MARVTNTQLPLFDDPEPQHPLQVGQDVNITRSIMIKTPRRARIVCVMQNGWDRRDGTYTYRVKLRGGQMLNVSQTNLEAT